MRKYERHLKLFLSDNISYIIMFLLAPAGLTSLSILLPESAPCNAAYYLLLCAALLAVFLAGRLYTTWGYYELLCAQISEMDEVTLKEKRCAFERHFESLCESVRGIYSRDMAAAEEKRRLGEQMLYQWVHQQKTPLAVVSLMAQKHPRSAEWSRVASEAAEMDYGLKQILDFYRVQGIERDMHAQRVGLKSVAALAAGDLKSAFIENNIYLRNTIDEALIVHSDAKWLRSTLYQLLANAIKYSEPKSTVTLSARREGGEVALTVSDEGCGIAREDISRVFELFFTGQNGRGNRESSGIGLYMVKTACDYLGHGVRVASEPGKGSAFTILFHERARG